MWTIKDDYGILAIGNINECKNALISWTKTQEAKQTYRRNELKEIRDHFKKIEGETSFYGFCLKKQQ